MRKKNLWIVFWIISIVYVLLILLIPIFLLTADNYEAKKVIAEKIGLYTSSLLARLTGLVAFVFWIYNIIVWKNRKDSTINLLLLIFLNIIYAPIYFIKELKGN